MGARKDGSPPDQSKPPLAAPEASPRPLAPGAKLPASDPQKTEADTESPTGPARPTRSARFSPHQLVAERFRILRFIGRGGMGEVYEAEDLELRERVALKTIRPEVAREEQALERFKREIHLARKVTHPGVCRVFDVFRDRTSEGETIVLSMELLAGETLAERLRRSGRMSTVDVLPLVSQMAAALEAAHEAGIVHRDFKTGNVMLVPNVAPTFRSAPEGLKPGVGTEGPGSRGQQADAAAGEIPTRQLRAVVTDFGLARSAVGAEDAATTLGATPGMAGTPAYMAPEQVEGGKVTAAADLYALGVVMYEMVTGRQPFVGDTPLSTAVKRLKEPPPSPRKLAPDLDPQWERVILRCLERNPAHRFASAADVAQALAGERRTFPERRGRRQLAAVVATILVLGVLAGGYWLYLQRAAPRRAVTANMPAGTVKARRSVAVLGFKNLSPAGPSAAWLSTAFSEMFASELAAGSQLRLVSGETVARMKKELSLSEAGTYANDTLGAIRKDCGADLVVLGSYVALGPQSGEQVRLDLRVQDTATGDTVATASEAGAEREIFDLVKKSGDELRKELGVAAVSVADATRVRASLPPNPEAARLYSEGLAKLRVFDALGARDLLEKAVVADPSSALAHSALARAWAGLGYEAKARNEAKEAMDLSPRLSREDRLEIEGSYYTMAHQYGRAAAVYRALWTFYPDNLDYGLRLAGAETKAAKPKDALATIQTLRKLPPPARDDPRIDLAEVDADDALGDYKREAAAAERALEKAKAQGARLLMARALDDQAWVSVALGDLSRAINAGLEAKDIYASAGDRNGVAGAAGYLGTVLLTQGDLAQAIRTYEQQLEVLSQVGNKHGMAAVLNQIANALYKQGDLAGAEKRYQQVLEIVRELGDKDYEGLAIGNLAGVLHDQGDLATSKQMYDRALEIARETGDQHGEAVVLVNTATILVERADLAGAKKMYGEALEGFRKTGDKSAAAYVLSGLGDVAEREGDLAAAREEYRQVLELRTAMGEKGATAESLVAMAELALEEGEPAMAETSAREAREAFRKEKQADNEIGADAVLARALLALGKSAEARTEIEAGRRLAAPSRNRGVRLGFAVAAARVDAATGKVAEATRSLQTALAEAKKYGFAGYAFEAGLALGEVEIKSGHTTAGHAHLAALEKETRAKGFGLIARKAASAEHN